MYKGYMPISVHIACDDSALRRSVAGVVAEDGELVIADTSLEAEQGIAAVQTSQPDVLVLAVPPTEDVAAHTQRYISTLPENTGVVGFCTLGSQDSAYRQAGVDTLVYTSDSPRVLRDAIRSVAPGG